MSKFFHELSAKDAVTFYKSSGFDHVALDIEKANLQADLSAIGFPWNKKPEPWEHTGYTYGFIHPDVLGNNVTITNATSVPADLSLKNALVKVSLDRLRIHNYPGKGQHQVLFKFTATNHMAGQSDVVSFNQVFTIQEGQAAAIHGYPIFINLKVGNEVLRFDTQIVNVSNNDDERLMNFLQSPVFQNGMKLIGAANPALSIVTEYATGITKQVAARNRNVEIVAPSMGLHFDNIATHMKLREGSYVAIQISDPTMITWNEWVYDSNTGLIRNSSNPQADLPYNYFIFSISRADGD